MIGEERPPRYFTDIGTALMDARRTRSRRETAVVSAALTEIMTYTAAPMLRAMNPAQ